MLCGNARTSWTKAAKYGYCAAGPEKTKGKREKFMKNNDGDKKYTPASVDKKSGEEAKETFEAKMGRGMREFIKPSAKPTQDT